MKRINFTGDVFQANGMPNGDSTVNVLMRNAVGDAIIVACTTIPNAKKGYAIGCELYVSNAANGQCVKWVNHGTAASCAFRPVGPVVGYGFKLAGGPVTSAGGDTTEVISLPGVITAADISVVEHQESDDSDQIVAQIAAAGKITITGSADPATAHAYHYAALRSGCIPEYDIVAAGTHITVGGAAAEDITISGVLATDIPFACYAVTNDTDVITKVVADAGKITVTMSADPLTVHAIHYMVLRPRGSFKPSHYVVAAGVHTTVGGAAAEAITVSGALATDVALVKYNATDDTDSILKSVLTANTLTVTMSADPGATHKLAYVILRAY